jgi:hypothetical protein
VADIIAVSSDAVKTDELDELARANVLRSDRAVKISTFVSMASTVAVRYAIELDPDALNEILRIANAIGNAAAQSSAMTQNARGPSAP